MPGYGILPPDQGRGLLPFAWAEERLRSSHSYWIATCRPEGRPHLMPVWGVWLDGQLFFSSSRQSVKARNLAATPDIVVATDNPDEAVMLEGTATLVQPSDKVFKPFNDAYIAKYDTDVAAMGEPVYAVAPTKVIAIDESDFVGAITRWIFETR
jgi:hypothetical protein